MHPRRFPFTLLPFTLLAPLLTDVAFPQDWPRFRGPNGTGISPATTIPTTWNEGDYHWKIPLPGGGHSSPILWANRIFLTTTLGSGGISLLGIDAESGALLWQKDHPFAPYRQHQFNSFASSSPAADAERVYFCWATPDRLNLVALDHDGNEVWKRNLGPYRTQHGDGISPMLYQDKLILANDQDGESFLIAVDPRSGETLWRTPRRSAGAAYSTPCVFHPEGGRPALLFNSEAHGISAIDPDDGSLIWEYTDAFDKRSVSSPVVASGLIIGSCGSGGGGNYVVAIRPPAGNDLQPQLAYEIRRSAPYVPTPVAVGELLFLWSDGGILTCVHAPTGEIKWQERVGGNFFGSPVLAEGRL
ncbi:MAG TPA: PQQ-binding-like beta-propeller repeat protein, partial [Methylomirabilota bacterium]|nr:PQQ-binding-like beta-propeller repeat protein [Methylomirabilota bacterium]